MEEFIDDDGLSKRDSAVVCGHRSMKKYFKVAEP
jgi:hypothetical protein